MSQSNTWDEPFLPWVESENDRRFKKLLIIFLLVFGSISIVVPFLPTAEPVKQDIKTIPPHIARLIIEKRKQPPPPPPKVEEKKKEKEKPKEKKQEEKKKEKKPDLKKEPPKKEPAKKEVDKKQAAMKKAASSGLLAMSNQLQSLTNGFDFENQDGSALKKSGDIGQQVFEKKLITSNVAGGGSGSGGINTSKLTRSTGGGQLATRTTTKVKSKLGKTSSKKISRDSKGKITRSAEEIQIVFQKNKGAIFSIYNRALRKDPTLEGKLILELTIAASGQVIKCTVISSELKDAKLERKIVSRVKLFKFKASGAKQVVIQYPIDFFPS